jgi:all-trans-retinol dehydrogenase (NAD+)
MIERDEGHVVTIASLAGCVGNAGLTDYSASKSAAYGFTESLRIEMKHLNSKVNVTCINPGYIDTGMFKGVKESLLWPLHDEERVAKRVI